MDKSIEDLAELLDLESDDLPIHGFVVGLVLNRKGERVRAWNTYGEPDTDQIVSLIEMAKLDLYAMEQDGA